MQTILIPTDFSPAGRNATEYAAQLARQFSARIILFHAYMLPTPVSEVPYVMATVDDLQKENEERLQREAKHIEQQTGLATEQIVRIGVASDEIRELTREKNVDLVVMGIKGAGGIDKIIGSTTINAVRKIKTPVLIIPHDAAYQPVRDIVYASDLHDKTPANLFDPLLDIAKSFGATVHILHVAKSTSGEPAMKKEAGEVFENTPHDYVTVTSDSITHGISEYLQNKPGQLLVMVAHKHSFFERIFSRSHTTAMAYETHIPLLILQDKE